MNAHVSLECKKLATRRATISIVGRLSHSCDWTGCDTSRNTQRTRRGWLRFSFVLMDSSRGPWIQALRSQEPNSPFGGGSESPQLRNGNALLLPIGLDRDTGCQWGGRRMDFP